MRALLLITASVFLLPAAAQAANPLPPKPPPPPAAPQAVYGPQEVPKVYGPQQIPFMEEVEEEIPLDIYKSKTLGISFKYPEGLLYDSCNVSPGQPNPCVGFKETPTADYEFTVEVKKMNLDDAVANDGCFEQQGDKWVIGQCGQGPLGQETTAIDDVNGWSGLYGTFVCGINDENGVYHADRGHCLTAFLSKGSKTVIFTTLGAIDTEAFLKNTVHSLISTK